MAASTAAVLAASLTPGEVRGGTPLAQGGQDVGIGWELDLPAELHARLYEVAIVAGTSRVLATSPEAVFLIDEAGEIRPVVELSIGGPTGESATLAPDGSRIGIMTHDHHALAAFRLLSPTGEILAEVESSTQFHYRIAPGGSTFVGIDAGGDHVPGAAAAFAYVFHDASGAVVATVESDGPAAVDSIYLPDGRGFAINAAAGVTVHDAATGAVLWRVDRQARLLAASGTEAAVTVVAGNEERDVVEAFRAGEALWSFRLDGPVRNVAVAPGGGFVVATDRSTAHLLTPDSGMPVHSFTLPEDGLTINDAAVNDGGVVALGSQHDGLERGVTYVLDAGGQPERERAATYEFSSAFVPGVRFDADGGRLLSWTLEELSLEVVGR